MSLLSHSLANVDLDNTDAVYGHKEDFLIMDTNGDKQLDAIEIKEFYVNL